MLRLTVSKLHSVTRYEVAPTERQTEDVLVEPFIDCGDVSLQQILATCLVCLCPSVLFLFVSNEVSEARSLRQFVSRAPSLRFALNQECQLPTFQED